MDPVEISAEATDADELAEEAAADQQAEDDTDVDDKLDQPTEEDVKSATDSSPTDAEEELEKEHEESPVRPSSSSRKKHVIHEEEDEPTEEPLISILSIKGKEKVITPHASDDDAEPIDAELAAAANRVTRTPTGAKHFLDIIATITTEG